MEAALRFVPKNEAGDILVSRDNALQVLGALRTAVSQGGEQTASAPEEEENKTLDDLKTQLGEERVILDEQGNVSLDLQGIPLPKGVLEAFSRAGAKTADQMITVPLRTLDGVLGTAAMLALVSSVEQRSAAEQSAVNPETTAEAEALPQTVDELREYLHGKIQNLREFLETRKAQYVRFMKKTNKDLSEATSWNPFTYTFMMPLRANLKERAQQEQQIIENADLALQRLDRVSGEAEAILTQQESGTLAADEAFAQLGEKVWHWFGELKNWVKHPDTDVLDQDLEDSTEYLNKVARNFKMEAPEEKDTETENMLLAARQEFM